MPSPDNPDEICGTLAKNHVHTRRLYMTEHEKIKKLEEIYAKPEKKWTQEDHKLFHDEVMEPLLTGRKSSVH